MNKTEKKVRSAAKRHGAFSAGLIAIAVAVTILFNLLVTQLPGSLKLFDLTNSGIYNITDTSMKIINAMSEDVKVIVLADRLNVDSRISRYLDKYTGLSDHLILEYIDPAVFPAVLNQYAAQAGDVVVRCEATDRQQIFKLDDWLRRDGLLLLRHQKRDRF